MHKRIEAMEMEPVISKRWNLGRTATLSDYGPYDALKKARGMKSADVVALVKEATVHGRGGAGFPAGMKWEMCAAASGQPKFIVCNADESEPGTFKDVHIMERDPHMLLEGMAIAGYAIGCKAGYLYIRGEFTRAYRILEKAIAESRDLIAPFQIHLHAGAGAYICGEETGLLESLEGKVGEPRLKPPFPATHGLWQKPTVVNNVETLACVPLILENGVKWWESYGPASGHGPKLYCISGDVVNPCVVEAPMGTNLRKLIYEYAGGPKPGRKIQAVFPGGSSAPPLGEEELDIPMDFKALYAQRDSMLGSAGVIVIDDSRCMVDIARNTMHFYAHESCGKCTPCRDGNETIHEKCVDILEGRGTREMLDYFEYMGGSVDPKAERGPWTLTNKRVFDDCFCALAKGSMWVFGKIYHRWKTDFVSHIEGRGCGRARL